MQKDLFSSLYGEMVGADDNDRTNKRASKDSYYTFEWITVNDPKHAQAYNGMHDAFWGQHWCSQRSLVSRAIEVPLGTVAPIRRRI
jgi:hypothetical protein